MQTRADTDLPMNSSRGAALRSGIACISSGSVPATHAPPAKAIAPDAPEVTIAASTSSSSAILAPLAALSSLRSRW